MNNVSYKSRIFFATVLSVLGMAGAASAQMQWSSYDTSGNLVTANVATGGDLASGTSVTFTIPAGTQLYFVTKNFLPFSVAGGATRKFVTFKSTASAGVTGVANYTSGWGVFNSAGTVGSSDDVGYFGKWNGSANRVETFVHKTTDGNNLFAGSNPGEGNAQSGTMVDGVTYTNQVQLFMKADGSAIALGSSSSTLATAGIAVNGPSLFARGYTNPFSPLLGGATTFDEFAFMFNNTTANPVTVTLSAIGLGDSLTWDASGLNPTTPTDGAGNWSALTNSWTSGANGAIGAGDSAWTPGYNAVIGANNGAAGILNISDASITVSNITVNPAGSGNYTISGNTLNFVGKRITTAAGTVPTIGSLITGNSFSKEGPGGLLLNQAVNNTYTGDTIVNNGALQVGSTGGRLYVPGNLIVNTNGTFIAVSGAPGSGTFGTATLVLNGQNPGNSNVFVNSGAWITASTAVLANGAVITNGGGGISGTYAVTNTDARSGQVWLTRHGFGVFNTIAKSTPGTVTIATRPNSSGTDGYIVTVNAGALVFDYAYSANASVKLKANSPLTFQGGSLVFSNSSTLLSPNAQNPGTGGTFFNSGASSLYFTNAGAGGGTITFGNLTRKAGATFNLVKPSGPTTIGSATSPSVNGILGGWHTFNLTDWTTGTTTWSAYSAYTTSADPTTWVAANNVSLAGNPSPNVPDLTVINTLRLTAASTVTLNGSLTLSSGGLLVAPGSGATAFTGGTLLGAAGADLIIHQNASADMTVSSTLADNASATSLTKDGVGKLIINGANTMTGTNFLNGGTVEVGDLGLLASGPLDMNGGTIHYTGPSTNSSRAVTTRGLGPIFDIVSGTKVTQLGAITGSGDVLGDFGGLTKNGNGTLILSASNNYNGETIINGGTLSINGTNNVNPTVWDAGRITVNATLGGNGVIGGSVWVKNGGTIAPGNSIGTLTVSSNLTFEPGSTGSFEVTNGAPGDLLVVQGNLNVQSNATISITVLGTPLQVTTNVLISYTGTKSGSFNPTVVVNGILNGSATVDESTPGQIKLAIIPQVAITSQPSNTVASVGDSPTLAVTATGQAPLFYQWFSYGSNPNNTPVGINNQTNAAFTIPNAQETDSGYYAVVVSNAFNAVSSRIAQLIVGNVIPVITGPTNVVVIAGNSVTLSTTVQIANPFPAFQWYTNGTMVPGATGQSVTFNNVQFGLDQMVVSVIATNVAGSATNSATISVVVPPFVTLNPTNLTVNQGDTAVFTANGSGVPVPTLQWCKNGVAIAGQNGTTLTIPNAQGSNIANYTLVASNYVGLATSTAAKLTVVSTNLSSTAVGPANGATGICYDTPLSITFNGPISVVNSGRVLIFNVNSSTPVDTIDLSSNTVIVSPTILVTNNVQLRSPFQGDAAQTVRYYPVICTGNTAAIYPHSGVLTSNQTYYVLMDNGVVKDSAGAYFAGITATNAWQFSTKVGGPLNPTNLMVATDNSGDFDTVMGAVDSVPLGNNNLVLVTIRNGIYTELVNISGKSNITFRGQSRTGTQVGYPNCDNINTGTAPRSAFKVNGADIKLNNLTIFNSTPQGGSQAEALLVYNAGLRCTADNCDIVSRQDTILINAGASQGYFNNCRVVGNFDYIWGSGVGFFTNCVFHTLTNILSGSYNTTAARTITSASLSTATPWVNPNNTTFSANGFSFVYCTFEADTGLTNITLAGSNGTAGGLDSWAYCRIDTNAYVNPATSLTNIYVFWQFQNTNITGTTPAFYSNIQPVPSIADPRMVAALSVSNWFSGWIPQSGNHPPVAAPSASSRNAGFSLKIAISSLAPNWSDPDGDTVTFAGGVSSTNGATVTSDANYIYYSNPNNVTDEIDYTISDGHGGTASGAIAVTIAGTSNNQTVNIVSQTLNGDGSITLQFAGIPNYTYWVEATTNLVTPVWVPISTNTAGPNGQWIFTDTNATNYPSRFYRTQKP